MDGKIIIDQYDLRSLAMRWFREDLPQMERAVGGLVGDKFSSARLMIKPPCGGLFPLVVNQKKVVHGKHEEQRLKDTYDGFEVLETGTGKMAYTNIFGVTLWSLVSEITLVSKGFVADPDEPMPSEVASLMFNRARLWREGYVHCRDCGERISATEALDKNRVHFAGIYCKSCWQERQRQGVNWG